MANETVVVNGNRIAVNIAELLARSPDMLEQAAARA
jgi:hypothetical protein